jgi:tetratricopeptide (TPR) repeat protein
VLAQIEETSREALVLLQDATHTARDISDRRQRIGALISIAQVLSTVDTSSSAILLLEEAYHLALDLSDSKQRAKILTDIARKSAQIGAHGFALPLLDEATPHIRKTFDSEQTIDMLLTFIVNLAKDENFNVVAEVLYQNASLTTMIGDHWKDLHGLQVFSLMIWWTGSFHGAIFLLQTLGDDVAQGQVFRTIASDLVSLGYFDEAIALTQKIASQDEKAYTLRIIVKRFAQQGCFDQAFNLIQAIPCDLHRARALESIEYLQKKPKNSDKTNPLTRIRKYNTVQVDTKITVNLLNSIKKSWVESFTRIDILRSLEPVSELVNLRPSFINALTEGITWADDFLKHN